MAKISEHRTNRQRIFPQRTEKFVANDLFDPGWGRGDAFAVRATKVGPRLGSRDAFAVRATPPKGKQ